MSERTYTGAELADRLASLPGWTESESAIRREFATDGWPTTLMLVNMIGFLCEAADHHPDLKVSWGKVEVRLNTHTAGGVTDKDLELAHIIEQQAMWKPAGGALGGTRKKWISS
jgi:4a-hydroxytetrahydrobiopterin dehydratase